MEEFEAKGDWRSILSTHWRATSSGPFFEMTAPPIDLIQAMPQDYVSAAAEFGGREGFLGNTYFRLYRIEELVALNVAYDVPSLLPDVIVFGSDGCGEAFAFPIGGSEVVQVPFLPLAAEHIERKASSFVEFITLAAATGESPAYNASAVGMEVHDKHPICFGGSPTDPANKVLVPAAKHAEICRFWNKSYRDAVARRPPNE